VKASHRDLALVESDPAVLLESLDAYEVVLDPKLPLNKGDGPGGGTARP